MDFDSSRRVVHRCYAAHSYVFRSLRRFASRVSCRRIAVGLDRTAALAFAATPLRCRRLTEIRLIVADDHPLVRMGVRSVLRGVPDIDLVAELDSPDALIDWLEQHACDVVLADLHMPGGMLPDGVPMLRMLRARWPSLPVLGFTMVDNLGVLQLAVNAGVRGLLLKNEALEELPLVIRQIHAGHTYFSASLRGKWEASERLAARVPRTPLSPREAEVLHMFIDGLTVTQISRALGRSIKTVSRQKVAGMAKLRLASDVELYAYAREQGLP